MSSIEDFMTSFEMLVTLVISDIAAVILTVFVK